MKTKISRLVLIVSVFLFAGACNAQNKTAPQDKTTYENLLKERDSVLSELVKMKEARAKVGFIDPEDLNQAQLELYTFRRDNAKSKEEKMEQQKLIIGVYEKQIEFVKSKYSIGIATWENLLEAKNKLLQEKILLEKLRLNIK